MKDAGWIKPSDIELFGTIIRETRKAYLFAVEDEKEMWLPKSLCSWDGITMTIPTWLAKKRRLLSRLPPDEHIAWHIILKPTPLFVADTIEVVK